MNPDESTLALWLDDELTGEELAVVESWAKDHPEQLTAREEIRRWRKIVVSALPASEEPPYPDFFNSRIFQSIRGSGSHHETSISEKKISRWRSWLMPLAACAGMAMAFWIGTQAANSSKIEYDVAGAPRAIPVEQLVYTPENGVNAQWLASSRTSAIIVLSGVAAIPDTTDFLQTVDVPMDREINSTADLDIQQ